MMQSKLASRLFQSATAVVPRATIYQSRRRTVSAVTGGGKTADPNIHAVDPEETNDAAQAAKAAPSSTGHSTTTKDDDPYVTPKMPGHSPKVQSTGVNRPADPITQQKRRRRSYSTTLSAADVECAGLDGSPWPEDEDRKMDGRRQRAEQEEDNKEYFEHHGASPLSELELADTRKPITRASDGTAGSGYYGNPEVLVWKPEQVDTAEDSLRRAKEIWMWNAMRGDPESPHGRILRKLRGEYW
ncbi:OLC1v1003689C1 [Oldenlandia corymbosa var. corymbosa]|uniref:OLC1v1003689C1 n=1 Tax=Oldenlandia corymbosa var. corymbosa TaxID=529605 RepID=A0AAV1DAL4_OLDCO|nr:OLC1v1003689C1 [Oldenlandia corymbosa var. corymbosa]